MQHQPSLPWSGATAISRHRSAEAAQVAARTRATKTAAYLRLLEQAGAHGLSDHEAARMTGWPLSSLCSIRNGCVRAGLVQPGSRVAISPYGCKTTTWQMA